MKILLVQVDGKIPNIALMRLAAHHANDTIHFRHMPRLDRVDAYLWDDTYDRVYASLIFQKSKPIGERIAAVYPHAILGGTGWDFATTLESIGVTTKHQDYSIFPNWPQSIGFTQRGCRLKCSFCVVPKKEGAVVAEQTIHDIWRGEPWPKEIILLDNDFFGQSCWQDRIRELQDGQFKVSFNQGINARMLTDEAAAAIASVNYRDDSMKRKCIYTAWDNLKDEERLFTGLERLVQYGVKPQYITVYMLCGYWPGETHETREHRRRRLREFGCVPYPMPYERTSELIAFQRWVVGAYDKQIPWDEWKAAGYYPTGLQRRVKQESLPLCADAAS